MNINNKPKFEIGEQVGLKLAEEVDGWSVDVIVKAFVTGVRIIDRNKIGKGEDLEYEYELVEFWNSVSCGNDVEDVNEKLLSKLDNQPIMTVDK